MSTGNLVADIVLMVILLLFSSLFSGSETAFFSLNSLEKEALRRRTRESSDNFTQLLFTDPDQVLVTILTGNMFVNIFASSLSEAIGSRVFVRSAELFSILSMTIILLLFGEMTPKNVAVRHSLRFARFSAVILRPVHRALRPITRPLGYLRHAVVSLFPGSPDSEANRDESILSAIRLGYQTSTIDESELRLLERFFRFRDKSAVDIMIPRVDSRPVDASTTVGEVLALGAGGDSPPLPHLIPIYRDDIDHISGYIRRSSLVLFRLSGDLDQQLGRLQRPVHAVPRGKDLRELLDEMTELGAEMAVVVDEYGGTEGIVTFDAVMRFLFGDFAATRDQPIRSTGESSYHVSGQADLREVEAALMIELPGDSRTVGGMVTDLIGDLPREGEFVEISGYRFTVERVSGRRIALLQVTLVDQP